MRKPPSFSFEFFPPKDEQGKGRLADTTRLLAPLGPEYVSVTFGAGGSTREGTYHTVREIGGSTGLEVAPHLSCLGSSREALHDLLERYREIGVRRIVALRGDKPRQGQELPAGPMQYANELVAFVREFGGFSITVGCYPEFHPESPDPETDIRNFVRKVEAGATEAITQYFFNNDSYSAFVDSVRRHRVDVPIIPGLMPLTDYASVARFSAFCGAEIPAWIRKRMEAMAQDPASQKAFGIELACRQVEDLLRRGAPGIHFYTLNRAEATIRIWQDCGFAAAVREKSSAQAVGPSPPSAGGVRQSQVVVRSGAREGDKSRKNGSASTG